MHVFLAPWEDMGRHMAYIFRCTKKSDVKTAPEAPIPMSSVHGTVHFAKIVLSEDMVTTLGERAATIVIEEVIMMRWE